MKDLGVLSHLFVCMFLFNFSAFMVIPTITDVTMEALCPGQNECSLAIYLTGFHQAMTGLGTLIITPLVGNLSDKYGRKALLTLPMTVGIIPLVILAYDRSRPFFYAYYVIKMITGMFCDGSLQCLSLAYVADKVAEGRRATAFGILTGISAAGFLSGTITARFLPTSYTFQFSASVAVLAAVYMKLFLVESDNVSECTQPLISESVSDADSSSPKLLPIKKVPSLGDMIFLLRSSLTLLQTSLITFFGSIADSGFQASLLYFLKAKYQFNKDQFADLLLIVGIAGAFSQACLMFLLSAIILSILWAKNEQINNKLTKGGETTKYRTSSKLYSYIYIQHFMDFMASDSAPNAVTLQLCVSEALCLLCNRGLSPTCFHACSLLPACSSISPFFHVNQFLKKEFYQTDCCASNLSS